VFATGDAHDSELWTDADTLATTYQRSAWQSISVRTDGKAGFEQFKAAVAADPRLKLDVETTRVYYSKQGGGLTKLIDILGKVIGTIMAVGAVFGALNTMYAAVATRAREIATMRAIGFRGLPVVTAVMLETMLLALLGGLLGCAVAWLLFNGYSVSTIGSNFSAVVFKFHVSPELLWTGLKWALGIGLVGGLFPALRAAFADHHGAARNLSITQRWNAHRAGDGAKARPFSCASSRYIPDPVDPRHAWMDAVRTRAATDCGKSAAIDASAHRKRNARDVRTSHLWIVGCDSFSRTSAAQRQTVTNGNILESRPHVGLQHPTRP
jgi:hypothetical protein